MHRSRLNEQEGVSLNRSRCVSYYWHEKKQAKNKYSFTTFASLNSVTCNYLYFTFAFVDGDFGQNWFKGECLVLQNWTKLGLCKNFRAASQYFISDF